MIKENYKLRGISINKGILRLDFNNYKDVHENIVGIYIYDNKSNAKNSISDSNQIKFIDIDIDLICKYIKINENFQLKSKIKLIDEVYYLPIVYSGEREFPIKVISGEYMLVISKDKNNFIEIKKEKYENEQVYCHFKLDSIENIEKDEFKINIQVYKSLLNIDIIDFKLINRKSKREIHLYEEKVDDKYNFKIDKIISDKLLNNGIWDMEYKLKFDNKCEVSKMLLKDEEFNNLINNDKNNTRKSLKIYKTANENLSIILSDKENYDIKQVKVYNISKNISKTGNIYLDDIYIENNMLVIKSLDKRLLNNQNIILKSRNNFIKYSTTQYFDGEFSYIYINLPNNFKYLNGIYDLKIDNINMKIENAYIIIDPLLAVDSQNNTLRIRPYITLDGNISFLFKNKNNIISLVENVEDQNKNILLKGKINIPYIKNKNYQLEEIYMENKEKIQFKHIQKIQNNSICYEVLINKSKIKNISSENNYIKFILKINGEEICGNMFIKDNLINIKNEIILKDKNLNLTLDKKYSLGIDNSSNLYIKSNNIVDLELKSIKKRKDAYLLYLNFHGLTKDSLKKIEKITLCSQDADLIDLDKNNFKIYKEGYTIKFKLDVFNLLENVEGKTKKIYVRFNYKSGTTFSPIKVIDKKLLKKNCTFKSGIIKYKNKTISLFADTKSKKMLIERRDLKEYELTLKNIKYNLINILSKLIKLFIKKDIWLIGENLGTIAQDNGFAFFKYCMSKYTEKKIFYVTTRENKNIDDLLTYNENILYYDSFKHKLYYCLSKFLIVSHGIRDVMPSILHNKLAYNNKEVIYLQHGITAMKKIFFNKNSYNGKIRKFIVCSESEKEIVTKQMGLRENQVLVSGFARFDNLVDKKNSVKKKKIIFMPTWRDWLIDSEEQLKSSEFYKSYLELFGNKNLYKVIDKYNLEINFIFHINMEKYEVLFKFISENPNIKLVDLRKEKISDLIFEGTMWITDYSSVVLDFNYLKKPSLFFQPDKNEYLVNRGSFVDFDTELVGDIAYTPEQLIKNIEIYATNNFHYEEKYENRSKKYYKYNDCNNSKRIYDAIISLDKE